VRKDTCLKSEGGIKWNEGKKIIYIYIYIYKCLSIKTKLKHYKTVVQPEVTYGSETLFKVTQKNRIDKILKVERRIVRTCINKKY
jgi:hypothetical protein